MSENNQPAIADVRRQFDEDAKQAAAVSQSTLLKILAHNKDTEYGKRYGFGGIAGIQDFKEIHPLTEYAHYEPFVKRMLAGEENVLAANSVIFFSKSSGTTSGGSQKFIPATNYRCPFRWDLLLEGAIERAFPGIADWNPRIMVVNAYGGECRTESGVRVGMASNAQLPQAMKMQPYSFTSPPDVFALTEVASAMYLHALYALKNPNPLCFRTTFVTALLYFIRLIENHWQELVRDIRLGDISYESVVLEPEVKQSLLQQLQPDPARADQLVQIFEQGFEGMVQRVWPNLQYVRCLAGGTFSIYVDKCKWYLGSVPIYSAAHGASEGLMGLNLWPGEHIARFVPVPQERYTEFIPVAETNSANPTTLELTELKEGESYEMVITCFDGLYRYRLGDIIKVVGHYGELPVYEIVGRAGTLLDISGERTTEEMVCNSLQEAVCRQSCTLVDYTTIIDMDSSQLRYLVFVELEEASSLSSPAVSELEAKLSQEFDRHLQKMNPSYKSDIPDGDIGEPRVFLVRKDTFRAAAALLVEKGASELQVKIPRYAKSKELVALLRENRLSF
ncbi:MAG: GH3 auxin-responsive promoter family protein [Oscillatoria princeps RMCB-10]|jgi:hypothetical protein|nr:GH3 auxin-responsive promoter family protein [Oscillatoria princeps RMCB-10]